MLSQRADRWFADRTLTLCFKSWSHLTLQKRLHKRQRQEAEGYNRFIISFTLSDCFPTHSLIVPLMRFLLPRPQAASVCLGFLHLVGSHRGAPEPKATGENSTYTQNTNSLCWAVHTKSATVVQPLQALQQHDRRKCQTAWTCWRRRLEQRREAQMALAHMWQPAQKEGNGVETKSRSDEGQLQQADIFGPIRRFGPSVEGEQRCLEAELDTWEEVSFSLCI